MSRFPPLLVVPVLAVMLGATPGWADSISPETARELVRRGDILSLREVLSRMRPTVEGEIIEVALETEGPRYLYRIKALGNDGRYREYRTGADGRLRRWQVNRNGMRILVVEDEKKVGEELCRALRAAGHVVELARDGEEAWFLGDTEDYDLVVLDLGLPSLDGTQVLKRWRANGRVMPVLILTARDSWSEKVESIDAGADDYLVKPFRIEEFMARVRALLRRATKHGSAVLTLGDVTLDTRISRVTLGGAPVDLSPMEYRLLHYLMHHAGRAAPQIELTEHIYAQDFERNANAIEVLVARIRRKLGDGFIRTRRGYGYYVGEPARASHELAAAASAGGGHARHRLALAITGFVIVSAFDSHARGRFIKELDDHLLQAAAMLTPQANGGVTVGRTVRSAVPAAAVGPLLAGVGKGRVAAAVAIAVGRNHPASGARGDLAPTRASARTARPERQVADRRGTRNDHAGAGRRTLLPRRRGGRAMRCQ